MKLKRRLALIVVPALLILAATAGVQAQDYTCSTNADNTINIVKYNGSGGAVMIPTNIAGLTVTTIGANAFQLSTGLSSITIPDTIGSIGSAAFEYCVSLQSVEISDSVTNVGAGAFEYCFSLTNFTVPANIGSVASSMFYQCSALSSVTIPFGITNIGIAAFDACADLPSITIPSTVTGIDGSAFRGCTGLARITIPNEVNNIGSLAFYDCTDLTNVEIFGPVTNIGSYAFEECTALAGIYFAGNAPVVDTTVFTSDNNPIAYYLPNTLGWSNTIANIPAVLWNPVIKPADSTFGVSKGQFSFSVSSTNNIFVVVQACSDLSGQNWTPLQSFAVTNGSSAFSEAVQVNTIGRFYTLAWP